MDTRDLTGAAPIKRAPVHIRAGRALRRLGAAPGATALSPAGAMMTVGLEAIVLSPYYDSVRVLTVFVGHTRAAGAPDPATLWQQPGTIGQAVDVFEGDALRYAAGVRRAFTRPLTPQQFDAAFDFNYHTGSIEVANWVKLFNAGQDGAAEQSLIANWKSQPLRTEAERQLFFHGGYAGDGSADLIPANDRGQLDWHNAKRVDVRGYFTAARWAA